MNEIRKYILQQVNAQQLSLGKAKEYLACLNQDQSDTAEKTKEYAIVGMSGMFPKAANVDEFWNNIKNGINCIDDFPEQRKRDNRDVLDNPSYTEYLFGEAISPDKVDDAYSKAGYLSETDKFDAEFFGIPPTEACYMDPCQRLVLQCAWDAIEDAGYGGGALLGSETGVFIGKESTNFSHYRYAAEPNPTQLTGSWESIIGSRISYLYDFKGPCMLVDTACSASLVSIHMATKSIENGECNIALAGGVNIIPGELKSEHLSVMSMDSVESDSGVVRTFDADANGTVWGEGVAMVMIKTLESAIQDGDHIHAIIKGSAINNDGSSNGLTAPNADSQQAVILKAWEDARIDPETLGYVEAHGTGTVLGDPIEFKGLTGAFRNATNKRQFCAIGSLKTNMGHLVASSGVASLFKVIKSMQAGQIPPTINFNQPNPYINFVDGPLYIADRLQDWASGDTPRRAAINSFGFSHTNCHMVIEEAQAKQHSAPASDGYLFVLSAKKQELLLDYIERYKQFCRHGSWNFADLCYTAAMGRGHYDHRLCIHATGEDDFVRKLSSCEDVVQGVSDNSDDIIYGFHKLVSDRKTEKAEGEVSGTELKAWSDEVSRSLGKLGEGDTTIRYKKVARLFCLGATVEWRDFFKGEVRNRQSQPTYPFERIRRWNSPKISRVLSTGSRIHPLIDSRLSYSPDESVYESVFSCQSHWILADHKIKGSFVVPGTTYLEMLRAIASHALFINKVTLSNIYFLQPMIVGKDEKRVVRSTIKKIGEKYSIDISSTEDLDADIWMCHVEAEVSEAQRDEDDHTNLDDLKENAVTFLGDYQIELDTGVFQFGPHWDTIRQTWTAPGISLAKLELPEEFDHELAEYRIHPSLLDNAMNLTSQDGEQTYLPYLYKSFSLYKPFTQNMYSIIKPKNAVDDGAETHSYDVILTDSDGSHIAKIVGYITKKVNSFDFTEGVQFEENHLGVRWVPFNDSDSLSLFNLASSVLVIGNGGGSASALADCMRSRNLSARVAALTFDSDLATNGTYQFEPTEQGITELTESSVMEGVDAIVFATDYDLDEKSMDYMGSETEFIARRQQGIDSLFYLGQKLCKSSIKLSGGITILTRSAFSVSGSEQMHNPLGAASSLFAKVLNDENPGLECFSLDIDLTEDAETTATALTEISPIVISAWRDNRSFKQEIYTVKPAMDDDSVYLDNGVYVISGGMGGLGLQAAAHIASRAKAHVVLLGRSDIPQLDEWSTHASDDTSSFQHKCATLLGLSKNLVSLRYCQVDIACAEDVQAVADAIVTSVGKVTGIFHAAGVAGDGFVMNKEFSVFDSVLSPKLNGTRNLIEAFASKELDFMVMYSSIVGIVGGQGQSDYAAANAFLDALVPTAVQAGVRLISMNWPSWEDIGMAVDFELDHSVSPFMPIHSDVAMESMDRIITSGSDRVLPSMINEGGLAAMISDIPVGLSTELHSRVVRLSSTVLDYERLIDDVQITGKSENELTVTEITLAKLFSGVLGVAEIDVFTSFQDMGGNSILATHLLKIINKYFPGKVEISDIFTYPSVDLMAAFISDGEIIEASSVVFLQQPVITHWGATSQEPMADGRVGNLALEMS